MPNTYSNIPGETVLPTPYEYALMCNGVYFNGNPAADANFSKPLSSDWEKVTIELQNEHGYKGCAYRNLKTNHIVIVHRGTSPDILWKNMHTNIHFTALNTLPDYIECTSILFSSIVREKNPGMTFSETGHSLGGMLAQLNGYKFPNTKEIVSFDNPGCGLLRDSYFSSVNRDIESKFISYLSAPNLVNTSVNQHLGIKYRIYIPHVDEGISGKNFSPLFSVGHKSLELAMAYATGSLGYATKLLSMLPGAINLYLGYDMKQHTMPNIIQTFDEHTGQPLLQREVHEWPSLMDYLSTKFALNTKKGILQNLFLERDLSLEYAHAGSRYKAGEFVTPLLTNYPGTPLHVSDYKDASLARFDYFYYQDPLRKQFVQKLSIPPSESLQSRHYPSIVGSHVEALTRALCDAIKYLIDYKQSAENIVIDKVKPFLEEGANPNCTIWIRSIFQKQPDNSKNNIGDFDNYIEDDTSLVDLAIHRSFPKLVELLCYYGVDLRKPNSFGLTPIQHTAILFSIYGRSSALKQIVVCLSKYGSDLHSQNEMEINKIFESWRSYKGQSGLSILKGNIECGFISPQDLAPADPITRHNNQYVIAPNLDYLVPKLMEKQPELNANKNTIPPNSASFEVFNRVNDTSRLSHANVLVLMKIAFEENQLCPEGYDKLYDASGAEVVAVGEGNENTLLRDAILRWIGQTPSQTKLSLALCRAHANSDSQHLEGDSHWTALHLRRTRNFIRVYYMDSLGGGIPNTVKNVLASLASISLFDLNKDLQSQDIYKRAIQQINAHMIEIPHQEIEKIPLSCIRQTDAYSCGYHAVFNLMKMHGIDNPMLLNDQENDTVAINLFINTYSNKLKIYFGSANQKMHTEVKVRSLSESIPGQSSALSPDYFKTVEANILAVFGFFKPQEIVPTEIKQVADVLLGYLG